MLDHYRRALMFRRDHACLRTGAQSPMIAAGNLLEFVRIGGGEQIVVIANLGEDPVSATLPQRDWDVADATLPVPVPPGAPSVILGPWQLCLTIQAA